MSESIQFKVIKDLQERQEEWLNTRQGKFCGSEVGTIVKHWGHKEHHSFFGDTIQEETSFVTPMMLFLNKKYGVSVPEPDLATKMAQQFGRDMETPMVDIYNRLNEGKEAVFSRDFYVSNSEKHPFGCSPDGFISINLGTEIEANNGKIYCDDGDGVLEIKTMRLDAFRKKEPSWSYILQLQWNMYCTGKRWGVIFATSPKSYEIEANTYLKGSIGNGSIEYMMNMLDFKAFYYKYDPNIITMIVGAISNFIKDDKIPEHSTSLVKLKIEAEMCNNLFIQHSLPKNLVLEGELAEKFDKLARQYLKTAEVLKRIEKKKLILSNKIQYFSIEKAFEEINLPKEMSKTLKSHKDEKGGLNGDGTLTDLNFLQENLGDELEDGVKIVMTKDFFMNHSVMTDNFGYVKNSTARGVRFVVGDSEKVEKRLRVDVEN